jgi:hypothetical protein
MDPKDYITFDEEGGPDLLAPATVDTITLSSLSHSNTAIGSGYGYSYPNVTIGAGGPYTFSAGTGITSPWATTSTKIKLDGEGADIEVNGWSLIDAIQKIEERLNILHPNDELEAEWAELRALGDQYRKLEKHIQEKQATWDRLKAMPPPEIK